jgi:predicted methyltransferase
MTQRVGIAGSRERRVAGWAIVMAAVVVAAASGCAVQQVGPIPESQIPTVITVAAHARRRPFYDQALDAGRQPAQVMAFYGIAPGMAVADLFAGTGYTTELLSRIASGNGQIKGVSGTVYSQVPSYDPSAESDNRWARRIQQVALANVIVVIKPFDAADLIPAKPDSLDVVLIDLHYHELAARNVDRGKINAEVYKVLKPGGVYGIIDYSAQEGSGTRDVATLNRIDEQTVITEVKQAGFRLVASSSTLRHPEDDRTVPVAQRLEWADRFMLKFVKPQWPI